MKFSVLTHHGLEREEPQSVESSVRINGRISFWTAAGVISVYLCCICVSIVQQCVTYLYSCRVFVNAVFGAVLGIMSTSWLQWSVVVLITSRLSGVSYRWIGPTVCRHSVKRELGDNEIRSLRSKKYRSVFPVLIMLLQHSLLRPISDGNATKCAELVE